MDKENLPLEREYHIEYKDRSFTLKSISEELAQATLPRIIETVKNHPESAILIGTEHETPDVAIVAFDTYLDDFNEREMRERSEPFEIKDID